MAIAYKSAGAGASSETSGAAVSPASPATVDANDILIIHAYFEGTTTAPSTPSGFELLSGPHDIGTTAVARHWIYGKIAAGTEDGAANALGTQAVTTMRGGRCYSFSGWVSGAITDLVVGFAATTHATDPQMPTVATTVTGGLAVACVGQNDNNTAAAATGMSGGTWAEAVAEYSVALTPGLMLQLQTCTPTADPGTVSGGSTATANDPCGVIGFEIRPSLPVCLGDLTASQAGDTISTDADVAVGSSATLTQAADTITTDADVAVSAAATLTQAAQTLTADATVSTAGVAADLNVSQAADTVTAASTVPIAATATVTQAGDSVATDVDVAVTAAATLTQADQTSTTDVDVAIVGSGSNAQTGDSIVAAAVVPVGATSTLSQAAQTLDGAANVGSVVACDLNATQAAQTISGVGTAAIAASSTMTQAADSIAAGGVALIAASSNATQASDTAIGLAVVPIGASATVTATGDSLAATASGPAVDDQRCAAAYLDSPILAHFIHGVATVFLDDEGDIMSESDLRILRQGEVPKTITARAFTADAYVVGTNYGGITFELDGVSLGAGSIAADGTLSFTFTGTQLDVLGDHVGVWKASSGPGGEPQTFPEETNLRVRIIPA